MPSLVIATGNAGKFAEFQEILGPVLQSRGETLLGLRDIGFTADIAETGTTFRENALLKAQAVAKTTPWPVLSDDSGLEVEALDWAPGVYTARFAGVGATSAANRKKLVDELARVKALALSQRRARFVCVLCYLSPGQAPQFFEARCEGRIALEEEGEGGFGYDPLFIPDGHERTFAALPSEVKHALSHRGKALHAFNQALQNR
jgi:XTP/dITP diphosphohydrolase